MLWRNFASFAMPLVGAVLVAAPAVAIAQDGLPAHGQQPPDAMRETPEDAPSNPHSVVIGGRPGVTPGCPPSARRFPPNVACIQIITYARNPGTGQCCEYANPCVTPRGWQIFGNLEACRER